MTDEDKALVEAMKDAVLHGTGFLKNGKHVPIDDVYLDPRDARIEALSAENERMHKQHEAFRQEVSDAVEEYFDCEQNGSRSMLEVAETRLQRFVITKPDPLVIEAREICARVCEGWIDIPKDRAAAYRAGSHDDEADFAYVYAALAKRGLEIREKE